MKTTEIIKIVTSLSTIVFSFLMIFANTKYRKTRNLHDYKKQIIYLIVCILSILIHYLSED